MAAMAMNFVVNPFAQIGRRFYRACEIIGYARAAAHLAQMGMYEEAARCMKFSDDVKADAKAEAETENENLKGWV